jgi:hypothetical protein
LFPFFEGAFVDTRVAGEDWAGAQTQCHTGPVVNRGPYDGNGGIEEKSKAAQSSRAGTLGAALRFLRVKRRGRGDCFAIA